MDYFKISSHLHYFHANHKDFKMNTKLVWAQEHTTLIGY